MSKRFCTAYDQGAVAKANGWERKSPYTKRLDEAYWYAGYDGIEYYEFDSFRKNNWRKIQKELKSQLGYSRIGLNNI